MVECGVVVEKSVAVKIASETTQPTSSPTHPPLHLPIHPPTSPFTHSPTQPTSSPIHPPTFLPTQAPSPPKPPTIVVVIGVVVMRRAVSPSKALVSEGLVQRPLRLLLLPRIPPALVHWGGGGVGGSQK